MTQKERLTELLKTPEKASFVRKAGVSLSDTPEGITADFLLANGVIVPPCKVGDKIYALTASLSRVYTYIVTRLEICDNGTKIFARQLNCREEHWMCWSDDFGNNDWVFLTREEAEKALAERSENGKS